MTHAKKRNGGWQLAALAGGLGLALGGGTGAAIVAANQPEPIRTTQRVEVEKIVYTTPEACARAIEVADDLLDVNTERSMIAIAFPQEVTNSNQEWTDSTDLSNSLRREWDVASIECLDAN